MKDALKKWKINYLTMNENYSIIISEREIKVYIRGNLEKFVAKVMIVKSPF